VSGVTPAGERDAERDDPPNRRGGDGMAGDAFGPGDSAKPLWNGFKPVLDTLPSQKFSPKLKGAFSAGQKNDKVE